MHTEQKTSIEDLHCDKHTTSRRFESCIMPAQPDDPGTPPPPRLDSVPTRIAKRNGGLPSPAQIESVLDFAGHRGVRRFPQVATKRIRKHGARRMSHPRLEKPSNAKTMRTHQHIDMAAEICNHIIEF